MGISDRYHHDFSQEADLEASRVNLSAPAAHALKDEGRRTLSGLRRYLLVTVSRVVSRQHDIAQASVNKAGHRLVKR
ncbi:hypothetical protein [Streptomyces sp. NPDC017435]|uniref:hypothetical protein n=1 Tax=Streptomyces sp. NPDC017435 TaxID=3364995 RepID=UPI0037B4052E